jgi:hypothetical protein
MSYLWHSSSSSKTGKCYGSIVGHVGVDFDGLVAVALASSIVLCKIGRDGHMVVMAEDAIGLTAHADMLRSFRRELLQTVRPTGGALAVLRLHNALQCKRVLFCIFRSKA